MRPGAGVLLSLAIVCTLWAQTPAAPTFRIFFLGHEIGREIDTTTTVGGGRHVDADFQFVDRGTTVALKGALDIGPDGRLTHFVVKGRNYRLFSSDSEVTVAWPRAHVRDLGAESDVDAKTPFFPADNYAPIAFQEELIEYWLHHGQPEEIDAPPAGRVRITVDVVYNFDSPRGGSTIMHLGIHDLVWGTETVWFDETRHKLLALATWAGGLPMEAIRGDSAITIEAVQSDAATRQLEEFKLLSAEVRSRSPPAAPAAESKVLAIVGATVIGAAGADPIQNATVTVRNGRILAVGPSNAVTVPSGAVTIHADGQYLIPGLWDMHAHASQTDWSLPYLAEGVTTIRDMGGEEGFLIAIRDAIASGTALGPRYLLAGLIDGAGPRAFGEVVASTPEEAKGIVQRYHAEGFQEIKIYLETPAALVPVIAAEAHRLGMTVTGHLPAGLTWQTAVEAGYDGIAHMQLRGQSGSDQSKAQIAFFKAHGTVMDPTQSWNELSSRSMTQPLDVLLPGAARLPLTLRRQFDSMTGGSGGSQANSLKLLKDAVDSGVPVVAGTDKGVPGLSVLREIELYVEGGMTPLEAIQAATIVPARAMKLEKDSGTVEVGKRADLVILSANPLEKISNIRTAQFVVVNGRLYDCATLWKAAGYR
jgi:imidazolonepropionase-like amidohydrolase